MITEDLIVYIQSQQRKNVRRDIIVSRLKNAGWHETDINEALIKVNPPQPPKLEIENKISREVQTPQKTTFDSYREPIGEDKPKLQEIKPKIEAPIIARPVFVRSFNEANKKIEPISEVKPVSVNRPQEVHIEVQNEELMPGLIPKAPEKMILEDVKISQPLKPQKINLPNDAMLHSYKRAVLSSTNIIDKPQKKSKILRLVLILFFIGIIGGGAFAIWGQNLKLSSFNFSLIKKDPKLLLASAPIMLSELSSYKIKTSANIMLPSFADITSGLASGERVSGNDKDFLTFTARGVVNNNKDSSPIYDYDATFESSMFTNQVTADIKYKNTASIISIPNLNEILGPNSIEMSNVLFNKGELAKLSALLPEYLEGIAKKTNLDKLISIGVPSYIDNETNKIIKDFVNDATIVEKQEEVIIGTPSYHYEVISNKESSKKFIDQFVEMFSITLNDQEKMDLDERLGAVTIDSFEIWIGKDDSKIHQYKFTTSTPLSRLIGLEDKGIAGNIVTLDWKTTYYDFDVPNVISLPEVTTSSDEFAKNVSDMKIKDKLSSFKQLADSFKNATGNYGKGSNKGSCSEPKSGTLFSPNGHSKGANNAVGNISSFMKGISINAENDSSCYSTASAWAISLPLSSREGSYFCADSTAQNVNIENPITGPICK